MIVTFQNTGNIFVQICFPFILNEPNSIFYRKNGLDVDLGVGVWHS